MSAASGRALGRLPCAALGAILLFIAARGDADADEEAVVDAPPRMPLAYAERPLTLPRLALDPAASFGVDREEATLVNLGFALAFGVTDAFEVHAIVAPLQLSPTVRYGQGEQPGPSVGAIYRFSPDAATVAGLQLDATVLTLPETSGAILRPGLPLRSHTGKTVRFDYGFYFPVTIGVSKTVGFQAPFAVAANVSSAVHIGFTSGLSFQTFDAPLNLVMPFGVLAGSAIGGKDGPILDIDPFFRWPQLLSASPPTGENTAAVFQVGVDVRWFLYL